MGTVDTVSLILVSIKLRCNEAIARLHTSSSQRLRGSVQRVRTCCKRARVLSLTISSFLATEWRVAHTRRRNCGPGTCPTPANRSTRTPSGGALARPFLLGRLADPGVSWPSLQLCFRGAPLSGAPMRGSKACSAHGRRYRPRCFSRAPFSFPPPCRRSFSVLLSAAPAQFVFIHSEQARKQTKPDKRAEKTVHRARAHETRWQAAPKLSSG